MRYIVQHVMAIGLVFLVTACASSQRASIDSIPSGAEVRINGQNVGTTPLTHDFGFPKDNSRYAVTGTKDGYHSQTVIVTGRSLSQQSGVVNLLLEPSRRSVLITSTPRSARVTAKDEELGHTPLEYTFDFTDRRRRYAIQFSKTGYFDRTGIVTEASDGVVSGAFHVTLDENPAWKVTDESEAANKWLRIQVDPVLDVASAWQKIVDSVTTVYDTLEQLDQSSGYIRSASKIQEFPKGPDGPFVVRTQFIGSISSKEPLVYKIKVLSTTRSSNDATGSWQKFDRVFALDAQLVEELQNRLGLK